MNHTGMFSNKPDDDRYSGFPLHHALLSSSNDKVPFTPADLVLVSQLL